MFQIHDKRFETLRELPMYREIHECLASGWPATKVAEFVQDERGELIGVDRRVLENLLREYRKAIPPGEKVGHLIPASEMRHIQETREKLDVSEELILLFRRQQRRLEIAENVEEQAAQLQPTTHKEFKEARDILSLYHQIQSDLGLGAGGGAGANDQRIQQVQMIVNNNYSDDAQKVMNQKRGTARVSKFFDKLMVLDQMRKEAAEKRKDGPDEDVESEEQDAIDVTPGV